MGLGIPDMEALGKIPVPSATGSDLSPEMSPSNTPILAAPSLVNADRRI